MTDNLFFGKLPARPNAVKLKFSTYADLGALPQIPKDFGHEECTPPIVWQMCANDRWGVCVVAGGMHETKLFCKMGGHPIPTFTDTDVAEDFTAITGLPPSPITGADMQKAAAYRQNVGLRDSTGVRHKIAAYLALQPGNLRELYAATYLFGAVGVGVRVSSTQIDQFQKHQAWHVARGVVEGYHYIPCMALRSNLVCVTWGRFQAVRPSYIASECDEALAYISQEALVEGRSPEGFDWPALLTDLRLIGYGT